MKRNWLVTGSSKGLGREIVQKALQEGDTVIATARNVSSLTSLAEHYPDTLRTFTLDVTDSRAAQAAVEFAIASFGKLDVLVNNAGYGHIVPFEQTDEQAFRAQVETNLFGVVNMTRSALPIMRRQRNGYIINISSIGGRVGAPGLSAYQSAKCAVSGFTESVAQEVRPFGVKMISVEPGGMRTDWGATANSEQIELLPDYTASVGAFLDMMPKFIGNEVGDPVKIAKVVFDLTHCESLPPHLILGSDALHVFAEREAERQKAAEDWREVSTSVDYESGDISYLGPSAG